WTYGILTLHRPSNVDAPEALAEILDAVRELAQILPIVFPCHPRTRQQIEKLRDKHLCIATFPDHQAKQGRVLLTEPLGYLEFLSLMSEARLVLTDSGGVQEETTVLGIPCLTLRTNTERPVTIEQGTNTLVELSRDSILAAAAKTLSNTSQQSRRPDLWDGKAAERIAGILVDRMT
ncbi:MAG TPA: UDP-N-acetylglucosamine 2-epimerase, partial [Nitrospirales bacterium]|nr:UDP-N-acetylglucosamine 2-epimerase [Nitrospirales bacterium]